MSSGRCLVLFSEGFDDVKELAEDLLRTYKEEKNVPLIMGMLENKMISSTHAKQELFRWAGFFPEATPVTEALLNDPTVDVTYGDGQALRQAVMCGCVESVKKLLADGRCDPRVKGCKVYMYAELASDPEIHALLAADPRMKGTEQEKFFWAAEAKKHKS
jgi:hypothetical protein